MEREKWRRKAEAEGGKWGIFCFESSPDKRDIHKDDIGEYFGHVSPHDNLLHFIFSLEFPFSCIYIPFLFLSQEREREREREREGRDRNMKEKGVGWNVVSLKKKTDAWKQPTIHYCICMHPSLSSPLGIWCTFSLIVNFFFFKKKGKNGNNIILIYQSAFPFTIYFGPSLLQGFFFF